MPSNSATAPDRATVRVVGVFAGPVRTMFSAREHGGERTRWQSAILKSPLAAPVHVGTLGLEGDAQKQTRFHGGPTRAVLVYGAERYTTLWDDALRPHAQQLADELRTMSPAVDASVYGFGAFGENVTVSALDETTVCLGDRWQIGSCVLQITEPRGPCATLSRRWMRPELIDDVRRTAAAGWYNAVHTAGEIAAGDAVTLVERMQTEWTLDRVFHLLEASVVSRSDVRALRDAACTHAGLRARLERRLLTPGRTRA